MKWNLLGRRAIPLIVGGVALGLAHTVKAQPGSRMVSVSNATSSPGGLVTLAVTLAAQGNENAVGFSLSFDPALLSYVSYSPGSALVPGSSLIVNANPAPTGALGVLLCLSPNVAFPAGSAQLASFTFRVSQAIVGATNALVTFADRPAICQVGSVSADVLPSTFVGGTVSVGSLDLVVTADNWSRNYGAANPLLTGTLAGLQPGDNITAIFSTTADTSSPVGSYLITATLLDPDHRLGSYAVTINNGTLRVTPAPLTVTANDQSRRYGASNPVFTGTLTGIQNGDTITASYSSWADAFSPAGTYPITATLADPGGKLGNYAVTSHHGTLTVNAAVASVAANPKSKIYGQVNPILNAVVTGQVAGGDPINYVLATTATGLSGVGSYPITVTLGNNPNYSVAKTDAALTVNPATLTGLADNKSRLYGESNPVFTVTYTGFLNGDNAGVVSGTLAGSTTADLQSGVGVYPITVSGQTAANYIINYLPGSLTVTPATLLVRADDASRAYGEANPVLTGVLTDARNGDNITASYTTVATALSPVGQYSIVPTVADPNGKLPNYSVTVRNGALTVNPAVASVTANAKSRIYGQVDPVLDAVVTGQVAGGDPIDYGLATTATELSGVGSYPITVTLGSNPNYNVTTTGGTLTLSRADLTITANDTNRVVGTANPQFTGTIAGLQNDDPITAAYDCVAAVSSPVGTYPIVPTLEDPQDKATNYNVALVSGTLTVKPATTNVLSIDLSQFNTAGIKLTMGGTAGGSYQILFSRDLVNWTVLTTVTASPAGLIEAFDPAAQNNPIQFYRALAQ